MPARIPAETRIKQINALPNIEFIGWVGAYGGAHSKAICRCSLDGFEWSAKVTHLLHTGSGCPNCAGTRRWTEAERVAQINKLKDIEFVRWHGGYIGARSVAVVRCLIDGFEWKSVVYALLGQLNGCPNCSRKRRWTALERAEQINNVDGISFISWCDEKYVDAFSRAIVRCECGHEWSSTVHGIVNKGRGCPRCAEYGFNPAQAGALYALRSECGRYVKIGISNDYEKRHAILKRNTPFDWECIEVIHGDGDRIARLERYFLNKYEAANFSSVFDGYTEWLIYTPELMKEVRSMGACNA